jgi:hypothetical protein
MRLSELSEINAFDLFHESPADFARAILTLAAQDLCFHCRDSGAPTLIGSTCTHTYKNGARAECKAPAIWRAPIMKREIVTQ